MKTCETCAHRDGPRCRRFPPIAAVGASALWPEVKAGDWCGEHRPAVFAKSAKPNKVAP